MENQLPAIKLPIEMVLFDYGNVIAMVDHRKFAASLHKKTGVALDFIMGKIFEKGSVSEKLECGQIGPVQFREVVQSALNMEIDRGFLENTFCDIFEPIHTTRMLIRNLKRRYRLGLLSNTNAIHFDKYIKNDGVFELFDQVTLSFVVGKMKPSPEIFKDALNKFGGNANRVLYLDDISEYVQAAQQLGIQSIVFNDPLRITEYLAGILLPKGR